MNEIDTINAIFKAYGETVQHMLTLEKELFHLKSIIDTDVSFRGHPDQAFGHISYAQHGEDMLFVNFFHMLGISKPTWLDIGAHHPLIISNTALLYKRGGRGVNIEANPNLYENFVRMRPEDVNVNIGIAPKRNANAPMTFYMIDKYSGRNTFDRKAAEEFVAQYPDHSIKEQIQVDMICIDDAVERYCNGVYPDLLTIDVENLDYDILASADFTKNRPKIICVEVISAGGDTSDKMVKLLNKHGFVIVAKTIGNYIFAEERLQNLLN